MKCLARWDNTCKACQQTKKTRIDTNKVQRQSPIETRKGSIYLDTCRHGVTLGWSNAQVLSRFPSTTTKGKTPRRSSLVGNVFEVCLFPVFWPQNAWPLWKIPSLVLVAGEVLRSEHGITALYTDAQRIATQASHKTCGAPGPRPLLTPRTPRHRHRHDFGLCRSAGPDALRVRFCALGSALEMTGWTPRILRTSRQTMDLWGRGPGFDAIDVP